MHWGSKERFNRTGFLCLIIGFFILFAFSTLPLDNFYSSYLLFTLFIILGIVLIILGIIILVVNSLRDG